MHKRRTNERRWLLVYCQQVLDLLRSRLSVPTIVLTSPSGLRARDSGADGWYVQLGRIPGDRGGALQIWLDRWPRTPTRKLWFGYKGSRREQIAAAAEAGTPDFGLAHKLHEGTWSYVEEERAALMNRPLRIFGRPVAELYTTQWSFYGVYLRRTPSFARAPSNALVERATGFLQRIGLTVSTQLSRKTLRRQLKGTVEGHPRYKWHRSYERSSALAEQAKMRDGYTCRICGINFQQLYGSLGAGFAEAHHIVPLSVLKKARYKTPKALITVCANCHRMLHQLPSKTGSVRDLGRRFTAKWPR